MLPHSSSPSTNRYLAASVFGHSEVLLRLVPAICGSLFPWVVMLWMQEIVGNAAALSAQLLLTFSPALIGLSAEVRAYTLAFLLFAIALLLLENSLVRGSKFSMIWFTSFCILRSYRNIPSPGLWAVLVPMRSCVSGKDQHPEGYGWFGRRGNFWRWVSICFCTRPKLLGSRPLT